MAILLICSAKPLEAELSHSLLWRREFERHHATRLEEGRVMAAALKPNIVLVDRDLPRAHLLISSLREDPATRRLSIAVLARGDFQPGELELLEAGANAILRLPPGPDWNERLLRLVHVPMRKEVRFLVTFEVEASASRIRGVPIDATGHNLSVSGMLIDSPVPLGVGTELEMKVRLPTLQEPIHGSGRVVRQAALTLFGVEFLNLEGRDQEKIRRLLGTMKRV